MPRPSTPLRLIALGLVAGLACTDDTMGPGVVSADQSVVTVSRDILASGTLADLTLETRDANGRRVTSGGHTVVFLASGGTSQGTVSPTTDRGDGTYTAGFVGTTAGTPTTIEATIDGQPVTQPLPTITVIPGPMAPTQTIVRVTPRTILVGGTATFEAVVRDAAGNDLGVGGSQVVFLAAGGTSAGTTGPVTDHGDGHYTATFTATAAGTPLTVGATIDGAPVVAPLPTLTVAYGVSPDSSILTVSSDTMSVSAGVALTLQVVDSVGVPRTAGGENVVFVVDTTAGTGRGTIDSTTDHDDGSYSATFTASHAGAVVLGATLNGAPVRNPAAVTILVTPLSPQQSTVSVSADSVAAGQQVTFTAQLLDLDGQPFTAESATVAFTLSPDGTSSGTIGPVTDHGDGSYTATFTGEHAGTAVAVGATINDSSQIQMLDSLGDSHLPPLTVTPGAASPDSSVLSAAPGEVPPGDSAAVALQARDDHGNGLVSGGRTVVFNQHGAANAGVGHFRPVVDHGDGRYTTFFVADTAGTADLIGATLDGAPVTSGNASILIACDSGTVGPVDLDVSDVTVNDSSAAQRPSKQVVIPSGVTTTIRLRARDSRTCLVTAPHAVGFSTSGGTSAGTIGPVLDQGDGSYTAGFTAAAAGTPTTVETTIDGAPVTTPPPTITVAPGDISAQTSEVSVSRAAVDSGAVSVVTLQARDAAGNALVTGGRTVTFSFTGGSPHGVLGPVSDQHDGSSTAPYTGMTVDPAAFDSITAQIEGTPVETPPAAVAVVAGTISPALSQLTLTPAGDSVPAAGDTVRVTLDAIDAAGRHLVGGGRTVLFGTSGGTSNGTFLPLPDPDDGTYAVLFLATTAGTSTTIGATIDGAPVTSTLPTLRVVPGAAAPATSLVLVAAGTIAVGDSTVLTLETHDAFGNTLTAGGRTVQFTVSTGAGVSAGTIGPVTDHLDGTYTALFHANAAGTPATIGATIDGAPVTTTLPTVTVQ
jgi:adhesin/invasin